MPVGQNTSIFHAINPLLIDLRAISCEQKAGSASTPLAVSPLQQWTLLSPKGFVACRRVCDTHFYWEIVVWCLPSSTPLANDAAFSLLGWRNFSSWLASSVAPFIQHCAPTLDQPRCEDYTPDHGTWLEFPHAQSGLGWFILFSYLKVDRVQRDVRAVEKNSTYIITLLLCGTRSVWVFRMLC